MNVSAWSIRNPIPAIMLFVLLTFAGVVSYQVMRIQQFPDIELPLVNVVATLPGAAPGQLETEVARKLENSISTIQGLKHVYSRSYDGLVVITAEFRLEKPLQEATDDVRSAVSKVRGELPNGIDEPIVSKVDLAATPVLAFTVSSRIRDAEALSWLVDNELTKRLLSIKGVGAISRVGGVEREITVALNPLRLKALQTTVADISRQLAKVNIERAGGKSEIGGGEQPLRTLSSQPDAEAVAKLSLGLPDGRRIRLGQVADVQDTHSKPVSAAFLEGKPVIGFEISRSRGAGVVEVGEEVRASIRGLQTAYPDLLFNESFDFVSPVLEDYEASMVMLLEGGLLAVLVVWFFLRDLRATFISAIALPMSIIPAFFGMHLMGITINVVTLLALSLVIGILVDDAIVEVENIVRHMRMGKAPYQASMEATDEIGLAVIATTFTLISVFLPTAFMVGIVGRFFGQFGWTAVLAIFASLVVARMLTPMMSAYMLKPPATRPESTSPGSAGWLGRVHLSWRKFSTPSDTITWMPTYLRWVEWCLSHRWRVLGLAVVFFFATLALVAFIPKGFVPPDDNSQTQVYLELPSGSTLQDTVERARQARQVLLNVEHVKSIYTAVGAGAAGSDPFAGNVSETRKATLTIQLSERGQRPRKQIIERQIREQIHLLPGVRSKVGLGGSGEKFQVALSGSDYKTLQQAARALERDLRSVAGVGNIESSASLTRTELNVIPDLERAAELGVTSAAISETLRVATQGDYDSFLPKLNLSARQAPIVVRLSNDATASRETLLRLDVPGSNGPVMLGQVASLQFGGGPSVIERLDRERNISFNVELAGIALGDMQNIFKQLPSVINLPPGVHWREIGDAEAQAEMVEGFTLAMSTGLLCIYVVLVLLFKAFWHPLTILAALPLSFGGAFLGLLITGKSLSMPSLIGLLMLMGVSTKNSILLVDYAIMAQRQMGLSMRDALLDACAKRARPIIMTSIAMSAGMLPVAVGFSGADSSFRSPMAVAVIGGLVTSTVLSLLVIPPAFSIIDEQTDKLKSRLKKLLNASSANASTAGNRM